MAQLKPEASKVGPVPPELLDMPEDMSPPDEDIPLGAEDMSLPEEDMALEDIALEDMALEEVSAAEVDELELELELLDEDEPALLLDPQAVRLRVATASAAIRVVVRVIFTLEFLREGFRVDPSRVVRGERGHAGRYGPGMDGRRSEGEPSVNGRRSEDGRPWR